ncbi:uncharacterized protein EI90DRAFT_2364887 [Cantharellus anzutake]|uniref:uncharacterized protein n=1 Tax=Cantharellus anzutake TaxID=1750568 RepID=UPI0019071E0E|nr:uncharacterized protein EI90DRAFT_2364887 [Cantharellus anzutake]KAF8324172.1 hypothetical protein EI90DRAFT_2364887 [Cantharellus anzutake]
MCQFVKSVEYLVYLINRGQGNDPVRMAAALIGALFKQVYERLGRNPNDDLETQMCAWSYKSVSRGVLFESVFEATNRSLANEIDKWHKELCRHFCLKATKNLAIDLQRLGHDKFIAAFDECTNIISRSSTLKLAVGTGSKFLSLAYMMSILALQRMIKAQDEFPIEGLNFSSIRVPRLPTFFVHVTKHH